MVKRMTLCLSLPFYFSVAYAQEEAAFPAVRIEGRAPATTAPTAASIKRTLHMTPKGANLIEPIKNTGSKHTLRDLLDYQPGITLLDFFGGVDQPVLTIRGSGIQGRPLSRGVMLLENGLPLNEADGSFFIGALEARDAAVVAVRRGANAINPASDTWGGELDFYTLTGREETGNFGLQQGSFDTTVARFAFGRAHDRLDYHISASGSRSDGYREHSDQSRYALRANFGIAINENFENRTWISYTNQKFQIPGSLRLNDVYNDPTSTVNDVFPMVSVTDPYRHTRQWRIANKSLIRAGKVSHDFGVYVQHTDDLFVKPTTRKDDDIKTVGAQYKLDVISDQLNYGAALSWSRSSMDLRYKGNPKNPSAAIRNMRPVNYDVVAQHISAQLYSNWQLADKWRLSGLLRFVHNSRDISLKNTATNHDKKWSWFTPKLGLMWSPTEKQTFFANVSTAREAPTVEQMIQFKAPPPAPASMRIVALEPQKSVSYEIGGRGQIAQLLGWDLTLYRSDIKKELIEYSPDGISTYAFNYAGKTKHQGIELGLTGDWDIPASYGSLHGRMSYTFNDFKFREGVYEGNRIAGVTRNMISASVEYKKGPWKIGINSRTSIGKTPTDHSNQIYYSGYTTWGASVNYQISHNAYVFLQGDNLTDKRYVSSTSIPARASSSRAYYFPGNGRSVVVGVNATF